MERVCIEGVFQEGPAPGCPGTHWIKVWTFFYSDGDMEQVRQLEERGA